MLDNSNYWTNTQSCKNCEWSFMLKITKKNLYEAHYMWVSWSKFGVLKVLGELVT